MSYVRPNIYRLILNGQVNWRERQELCVEFFLAQTCPSIKVWVETHHPPRYDEKTKTYFDESLELSPYVYVYGRQKLEKKKLTYADMATYQLADVLARDSVVGKEAGAIVHSVVYDWIVRAPKTVSKPISAAAPEWWASVTRKD
jgi:hypothetical protein